MKKNDIEQNLNDVNQFLLNKIVKLDENSDIQMIQVGSSNYNDQDIQWIKLKLKSGNTYLFTAKTFVDNAKKIFRKSSQILEQDDGIQKKIVDQLLKKIQERQQLGVQESLSEAEKNVKAMKSKAKKQKIAIQTTKFDNDNIDSFLTEQFSKWYKDMEMYFSSSESPIGESRRVFDEWMHQEYTPTLRPIQYDIFSDDIPIYDIFVDGNLFPLHDKDVFISNIDSNVWELAMPAIHYCGTLCKKEPKFIEDLDDMNFKISDLEGLESRDEENDDEENDIDTKIDQLKKEIDSEE